MLTPVLLLLLLLLTTSLATSTPPTPPSQLPLQDFPPTKFPWLQTFASIGDSYSAGLGAGPRLDFPCSRYAHSHPHLLHTTLLGANPNRTHQFLSCSGQTSTQVLETQIPQLGSGIDVLTISAGGNDVGLGDVLSNCIYQFYLASEEECKSSIREAARRIEQGEVYGNVLELVSAARRKMHTHGVIYITGYAAFFSTADSACDNVTWAVWSSLPTTKQYLQLPLRHALNSLVQAVNGVLARVAVEAGSRVQFIDYNERVKERRGRYCEGGVREPAPNHEGLLFYEWGTVDGGEDVDALQRVTGEDVPGGSWEAGIAGRVERMVREYPEREWGGGEQGQGRLGESDMGYLNRTKLEEVRGEGAVGDTVHWLLPDCWKRVFHLRPGGHAIVGEMVVEDLERREREREENMEL